MILAMIAMILAIIVVTMMYGSDVVDDDVRIDGVVLMLMVLSMVEMTISIVKLLMILIMKIIISMVQLLINY